MLRETWMKVSFSLLLLASLAGCNTISSGCPTLKTYTPQQLKRAAAELRALPKDSQIGDMVIDYRQLRDACRVQIRQFMATDTKHTFDRMRKIKVK